MSRSRDYINGVPCEVANRIYRAKKQKKRTTPMIFHKRPFMDELEDKEFNLKLGVFYFKGLKPYRIFINVQQILIEAKEYRITLESQIAETISHELIHDILFREISADASQKFDSGGIWTILNDILEPY